MAQYIVPLDKIDGQKRYEIVMLASGKAGDVVTQYNPLPTTAGGSTGDAFGRLRVSDEYTLGDHKHIYNSNSSTYNTLAVNGATIAYRTNEAAIRLSTGNNPAARAVQQTKMYHHYMPGKSQLIKASANFYAAVLGVTKRIGYYDDRNGIFLQQEGDGTLSFVIRTYVTGVAVDTRKVVQADWNIDKCNGTGNSGFNIDITKTQIFFTDFQWLGVGRVRCGFVHDGETIVAHEFYNSNVLPTVYISSPNLPIRSEVLNTGATTGGYMDQICSTVVSEGGYAEAGVDFAVDGGIIAKNVTTSADLPIVAIRLKNAFQGDLNRVVVRLLEASVYAESNAIIWKLVKLPNLAALTLTNATWTAAHADSAVEYNLTGTAYTGGETLANGFSGASSPGGSTKGMGSATEPSPTTSKRNFIAQNMDSTDSEIYVLAARAIAGPATAWGALKWREIY
jgi:hypothetical protein